MNADKRGYLNSVAARVIGGAFEVSNVLGAGFLEKVYQNALANELRIQGMRVNVEHRLQVVYKGKVVGDYVADLIVNDELIVELKCVEAFAPEHMAQCLNYLRATSKKLVLLLNFQKPRVEIKRIALGF